MGCALQIKFTAALVLPALIVELLMNTPTTKGRFKKGAGTASSPCFGDLVVATGDEAVPAPKSRFLASALPTTVEGGQFLATFKAVLVWLSAVAAAFAAIAILSGETFQPMWQSHTLVVSAPGQPVTGSSGPQFTLLDLSDDLATLAPTVLGLLAIVWRRAWRQMAFPLVFLATCLAVHLLHSPYWSCSTCISSFRWRGSLGMAWQSLWLLSTLQLREGSPRPALLFSGLAGWAFARGWPWPWKADPASARS